MASPYLQYGKLVTLANVGGYEQMTALTNLSAVFLLSACVYLQNRDIWQSVLEPVPDNTYNDILEMIAQAEYELMNNIAIATIIPSVTPKTEQNLLRMDNSVYQIADYPELAANIPSDWISGSNFTLPDLGSAGLFGASNDAELGSIIGENDVTLLESEMPVHTHTQNPHQHTETSLTSIPTAAGIEPALASLVTIVPSSTGFSTATNNDAGNGQAHNNIQKSMRIYWYIVAW
jgi:hypothetical protein